MNLQGELRILLEKGNLKGVYNVTLKIWQRPPMETEMVRDQDWKLLTAGEDISRRWQDLLTKSLTSQI